MINNCGKVTIDNIRRSLSTFFLWLQEEEYIIKSPMKRIHKVKTTVVVKETISDEKVEILRDNCDNLRNRAIEKGMLIEQVQKILGHEQIDTTIRYAMVNQNNVKLLHRKYIS